MGALRHAAALIASCAVAAACRGVRPATPDEHAEPMFLGDDVVVPSARYSLHQNPASGVTPCVFFLFDSDKVNALWPRSAGWQVVGLSCETGPDTDVELVVDDLAHGDEVVGRRLLPSLDGFANAILAIRTGLQPDARDPKSRPPRTCHLYSVVDRRVDEIARWPIARWIACDQLGQHYHYHWWIAELSEETRRPLYPRQHYFDTRHPVAVKTELSPVLLLEPEAAWNVGTDEVDPAAPVLCVKLRLLPKDAK